MSDREYSLLMTDSIDPTVYSLSMNVPKSDGAVDGGCPRGEEEDGRVRKEERFSLFKEA